jgi:F0F1-type ATP synthase membrane subunit b/b'
MNKIAKQLKELRQTEVNPNQEWLKTNRELLLLQIKNTVSAKDSKENKFLLDNVKFAFSFVSFFISARRAMRPMVVALLVLMIGAGGWIATVEASYEALPGEWLYPAKRVTEKTQAVVTTLVGTKSAETKMHVEFAKRRAVETKKIVASQDPERIKNANTTVNELKQEIKNVNTNLEEMKNSRTSEAAKTTKDIGKEAEEIKDVLKEVKVNLLASVSSTVNTDLTDAVKEAKDALKDTAVKAVEVLVSKHLDGDQNVSKAEVNTAIITQLQSSADEAGNSKDSAAEVNNAVKDVVKEAKIVDEKNVDNKISAVTAVTEIIKQAASTTADAAKRTNEMSSETDKKVVEAKQFLTIGDLSKAMNTIKEVNNTAKEAEKISDNSIKSVQTVLPVVAVVKEDINENQISAGSTTVKILINTTTLLNTVTTSASATVKTTTTSIK